MKSIGAKFGTMNVANAVRLLPETMSAIPSKIDSVLHRVSAHNVYNIILGWQYAIQYHRKLRFTAGARIIHHYRRNSISFRDLTMHIHFPSYPNVNDTIIMQFL